MTDRPKKLYKYRSLNGDAALRVGSTIFDGHHYFAGVGTFNDPFEGLPQFVWKGTPKERVEQWRKFYVEEEKHDDIVAVNRALGMARIENPDLGTQLNQYRRMIKDIPVFCLSATRTNILMWSHYAQDHTGICLEYDGASGIFEHAAKVIYSNKRAVINLGLPRPNAEAFIPAITKSKDWSYEKEWRLVDAGRKPGVRVWPAETLTGIVMGDRISDTNRARVMAWVERRQPMLKLRQATISDDKYKVDINDL